MEREEGRTRARLAIHAEMSHRRWTNTELSRQAGVDINTIGDFLSGARWPKSPTQGRLEAALGWPPGTITAIAAGMEVPPVGGDDQDAVVGDEATLRFRRPPGFTDEEWGQVLAKAEGIIEWTIEQVSRER